MRPFTGTECHTHAFGKPELLHKCCQLPPSFHLSWLHVEICRSVLQECYFILSLSNLSQVLIIAFQRSLLPAPEHYLNHHTLLPSQWPSWLSLFTPAAWSPQLAPCPSLQQPSQRGLLLLSDFLPHMRLFNCPATCPTTLSVGSLPTSPSAMSGTP